MSAEVPDAAESVAARPRVVTLVAFAALCSVLAPLNSTMIAVALPQIRDDFGLTRGTVGWLISAYLITMAVVQPVAGRLGDQLGRGRVVRVGLTAFVVASVATSFAPTFPVLIALRVVQAVFAAGLIPNALALIREHAPGGELGRLNGLNAAAIAAAAGLGPLLGAGALVAGSWRLIFPASLPFAAGALVLFPRMRFGGGRALRGARTDWVGTAYYAALLIAVTALLGEVHASGDLLTQVGAWLVFAVALALFVQTQRHTSSPVAAWALFRYRSFFGASAQILLTNLTMYTTLLMVPFLVTDVLGSSAAGSGVLLGIMAAFMGLAAPFGGRLSDLRGRRRAALLGATLVLASTVLMAVALRLSVTEAQLALVLVVLGAGVGVATGAANTAAVESVPTMLAGTAAGTSSMMRYVGSIVGTGVLTAVLSAGSEARHDAAAFQFLVAVMVVMAVGAACAATLIHAFAPADSSMSALRDQVSAPVAAD